MKSRTLEFKFSRLGMSWNINIVAATYLTHVHVFSLYENIFIVYSQVGWAWVNSGH